MGFATRHQRLAQGGVIGQIDKLVQSGGEVAPGRDIGGGWGSSAHGNTIQQQ
jgi:hypothetical protein